MIFVDKIFGLMQIDWSYFICNE